MQLSIAFHLHYLIEHLAVFMTCSHLLLHCSLCTTGMSHLKFYLYELLHSVSVVVIGESWFGEDLAGSGSGLSEVLPGNLPRETEWNMAKLNQDNRFPNRNSTWVTKQLIFLRVTAKPACWVVSCGNNS